MKAILLCIIAVGSCGLLPSFAQQVPWDEQDTYVNGFARVFRNDLFSYADAKQQLIAPFRFEDARPFYHHLAAVKQNGKWGYINEKGISVVPCMYDIAFNYASGVALVNKANKWWLLDNMGRPISQPEITRSEGFKNGSAVVYQNNRKGIMDTKGNIRFVETESAGQSLRIPYTQNASLTTCPDNLDFEYGNFTNWQCYTGRVDSVGNTNVITVLPSPPTPGRHTMYARAVPSAIDAFGLFPTNPPDGSQFAVKLGNTNVGAQAERIRYTIRVPQNDSNFSFRYHYAVVLQDPGHTTWTQPRFNAKLLDSATNTYIPCASFEYISTAGLPGFFISPVDPTVIYKAWSPVFISLRGYAGKTLYLEFTTADCVRRAHWGYAYVDVEDMCGQTVQVQYNCDTPHITTLTGPPGFQFYNWWNQNFTQILGTGQTVTLNPGPPPNTTLWLEVIPFANFGCLDTIPILITGTTNVSFAASDTLGICAPHSFTFYNRNLPSTSVTWNFGDGNTGVGDTVIHTYILPGTYIVTMNATLANGCSGVFIDTVRVVQPSGAYSYTGGNFCNSHTVTFTATTNYVDSLFWDFGDGTYLNTTQTTVTHTYNQPGVYIPHLTLKANAGCQLLLPGVDTIRIEQLSPGFTNNLNPDCGFTDLLLADTSTSFFGITGRTWDFGDGSFGSTSPVTHRYTSTGTYTVKLYITGAFGCQDSVIKTIFIKINNRPAGSITGDTLACRDATVLFSSNVVSVDPVNYYAWACTNGASGTNPNFSVTFPNTGIYFIQLITGTVFNCYDTVYHVIRINPVPSATIDGDATVCANTPSPQVIFTASGSVPPYLFTYNINGGPNQTISSGTGNWAAVPAPTSVAGVYRYALVSVSDGSSTACSSLQPDTVTIQVNPIPNATISNGASLCLNDPSPRILFTGSGGTAPYTFWYRLIPGPDQTIRTVFGDTVSIPVPTNQSGTFSYALWKVNDGTTTACSRLLYDTTVFIVHPLPPVYAGPDRDLCQGSSVQLVASGAAQYNWSPAVGLSCNTCPNPVASPTDTMQYVVRGTSAFGCVASDSLLIRVIKPFPMFHSPDDTICVGGTVNLNASGAKNYLWSPAAGLNRTDIASPIASPQTTTTYRVIGYDDQRCFADTAYIVISVGQYPVVDAGPDLHLATGDIVTLNTGIQNGPIVSWLWEPATDLSCNTCPAPRLTVHDDITYKVTVTNNYGCVASDFVHISTFCKSAQVFVPNAFTPDGDGYNDVLMVRGKGIHINYFRIFSRWGELVFERKNFSPNDPQFGWDGTIRGVKAPPDVFVYTAEVVCDNRVQYTLKGNTSLLK